MSEPARRKAVFLLPAAERDIADALEYYRREGGSTLAVKWAQALETTLRAIVAHPAARSPRYGTLLKIEGLRYKGLVGFPWLIFYHNGEESLNVWRVLHGRRDIPAWLQAEEETP